MTRPGNNFRVTRSAALAVLGLALSAPLAHAQIPSASAAALGMGDNYTALARGYSATAWNPAGLGVFGNPKVSFALLSPRLIAGLDPVSLKDLEEYEGTSISAAVRQGWLDEITAEGSQQGTGGADVTFLAASVGRVGIQLSASGRAVVDLGPGASELLLFGNAGRTGQPVDLSLEASSLDVLVTSTVALSYAQPFIRTPDRSFSVGATVKYTYGNAVLSGVDNGSVVRANPLGVQVSFPMVMSDTVAVYDKLDNGSGIGLDVGAMYQTGPWSAGVVVKNVVNTFGWDEASLFYRPGEFIFNDAGNESDVEPQPFTSAPEAIQNRIDDFVGQAEVAGGLAFRAGSRLLLSADFHQRLEDSPLGEPKSHIGAGAELRLLSWLPIRAGGAILDGGSLLSAGAGLEFGVLNLTVSAAQRDTNLGADQMVMFTFSSLRSR